MLRQERMNSVREVMCGKTRGWGSQRWVTKCDRREVIYDGRMTLNTHQRGKNSAISTSTIIIITQRISLVPKPGLKRFTDATHEGEQISLDHNQV